MADNSKNSKEKKGLIQTIIDLIMSMMKKK